MVFFLKEVLHEQLTEILPQEGASKEIDVNNVMKSLEKFSSGENLLMYIFPVCLMRLNRTL